MCYDLFGYVSFCPECGAIVNQDGCTTSGQHWYCDRCGCNDRTRTYRCWYTEEAKTEILRQSITDFLKTLDAESAKKFLSSLPMYNNDGKLIQDDQ